MGVLKGFLLGKAVKNDVSCCFCGKKDGDGHFFWGCSFPPLQHVRELPEFAFLMLTLAWLVAWSWRYCS